MPNAVGSYSVALIGFNQTERIVLGSIFGLSARRTPTFVRFSPDMGPRPNIYLVDASSQEAIEALRNADADRSVPAILIGDTDGGTGWPVLARPIQWTRVFKAFDLAVGQTPPIAAPPPGGSLPAKLSEADSGRMATSIGAATDAVLVVDDDKTVREFLRRRLDSLRLNLDFASSGEEAIGMVGARHYTCVFLDVMLPGVDGYQVCKLIKSRKTVRKTHVVMLTSKGSPFDKIRGAMAGCDAYLTKPVDDERLRQVIAKLSAIAPTRAAQ